MYLHPLEVAGARDANDRNFALLPPDLLRVPILEDLKSVSPSDIARKPR